MLNQLGPVAHMKTKMLWLNVTYTHGPQVAPPHMKGAIPLSNPHQIPTAVIKCNPYSDVEKKSCVLSKKSIDFNQTSKSNIFTKVFL